MLVIFLLAIIAVALVLGTQSAKILVLGVGALFFGSLTLVLGWFMFLVLTTPNSSGASQTYCAHSHYVDKPLVADESHWACDP